MPGLKAWFVPITETELKHVRPAGQVSAATRVIYVNGVVSMAFAGLALFRRSLSLHCASRDSCFSLHCACGLDRLARPAGCSRPATCVYRRWFGRPHLPAVRPACHSGWRTQKTDRHVCERKSYPHHRTIHFQRQIRTHLATERFHLIRAPRNPRLAKRRDNPGVVRQTQGTPRPAGNAETI